MKLGISLPDDVFRQVDRCAKRLGVSRSELLATAARQLLAGLEAKDVTASYDRAFGAAPTAAKGAPAKRASAKHEHAFRLAAARAALRDIEW